MLDTLIATFPFLITGFQYTVLISVAAIVLGSLAGFVLGMIRTVGPGFVRLIIGWYVHLIRATPFLVQIYIVFFVLPETGWEILRLSSVSAAILALSIYASSYVTEIVRGAMQAVDKGQWEAATALGMSLGQRIRHVILPQAWKLMLPPIAGVYVLVVKGTSILAVIGVTELLRQGQDAIYRHPAHIMPILLLVAMMYFLFCFPILRGIRHLEIKISGNTTRNPMMEELW